MRLESGFEDIETFLRLVVDGTRHWRVAIRAGSEFAGGNASHRKNYSEDGLKPSQSAEMKG